MSSVEREEMLNQWNDRGAKECVLVSSPFSLQSYLNMSLFQQSIVTIGRRENNFDTIHVAFRSIAFVQQHTKCNRSVHAIDTETVYQEDRHLK